MFVYGGCQGNSNNFGTIEECNKACSHGDETKEPILPGTGEGENLFLFRNKTNLDVIYLAGSNSNINATWCYKSAVLHVNYVYCCNG